MAALRASQSRLVAHLRSPVVIRSFLSASPIRDSTSEPIDVLRSLAFSNEPDAARKAERWVRKMEMSGQMTTESYQRVIQAWASSSTEDPEIAVTRSERWLFKHIDDDALRPTTESFNAFLDVCSKGRYSRHKNSHATLMKHANKAQEILQFMMEGARKHGDTCPYKPNVESFNFLIRAWTRPRRNPEIAERAMDALSLMKRYSETDPSCRPNRKSYTMVMDAYATRAKMKAKACSSKPIYNRSPSPASDNGLQEIHALIKILKEIKKNLVEGPDTYAYNILIRCWADISRVHHEGPTEAEKILSKMLDMYNQGNIACAPDAYSFSSAILAHSMMLHPDSVKRIEYLLEAQWNYYETTRNPEHIPHIRSYNIFIRCLSEVGMTEECDRVIIDIKNISRVHPNLRVTQETLAFNVRAWLRKSERGDFNALLLAYERIKSVSQEEGLMSFPDELFLSAICSARKHALSNPYPALKIAVDTFALKQKSYRKADCIHYARLLEVGILALSRECDKETRDSFISRLFESASREGKVSNHLVRVLANGPVFYDGWTARESERVMNELKLSWPLPDSMTRNAIKCDMLPVESDFRRTNFKIWHRE